jgi:uncharacterized membrane protein YqaE (UPF0057 family)
MMYILAILLPPLAVLLCGKPIQALINLVLTVAFYFPGMIHALFIANNYYAEKRQEKLLRNLGRAS